MFPNKIDVMSSSIGNDTASSIVTTDSLALISQADAIVIACTGTNCNTSSATRTQITQQSSTLAQRQASYTLTILGISRNSILGRNINVAYLNLGAAVASVYNFQCGDNINESSTCVSNATSVQNAQNTLRSLLVTPATDDVTHIIVISILSTIGFIALFLFFIFMMIGILENIASMIVTVPATPTVLEPSSPRVQIVKTTAPIEAPNGVSPIEIATPASPFDKN